MLNYSDDVNGTVIGTMYMQGAVFYDGRKQGKTLYAESDAELRNKANEYFAELKKECGEAFTAIYPNVRAFELRIFS